MTYQSPTDDGAGAASPANAAMVTNGNSGALRTVLVCDVVDSVHWMQVNEAAAIAQWQTFIDAVKQRVIPKLGGRLVKSLGDGLMLEFLISPQDALNAAFAMKEIAADIRKADTSKQDNFWLRMALHHTTATVGEDDIYGHGVNLCARIATLAGPGEVVISTEMRDQLTDRLDADLEDMGECFLKHIEEPVRVYRAGPVGHSPILMPKRDYAAPLQAIVAVIPFAARSLSQDNQLAVGEIIADGVIGQLSRTPDLKVISRLSTSVFRNRINSGGLNGVADIESHLGANYVLSGSYIAMDKKLIINVELIETKTNQIVWMDRLQGDVMDLLQLQSELCHTIANATHMAILTTEVQAALTKPLPTLESYSLLLGGISMMFHTSKNDFYKSKSLLFGLMERHQNIAAVPAWLANWHVLQVVQGWTGKEADATSISKSAWQLSSKALSLHSNFSFARTISGLVSCYLLNDFDNAYKQYTAAIELNPNEAIAWLYKGMLHAFKGEGDIAVHDTLKACELSPLDPHLHFYQSLTASAYLTAAQYEKSIEMAKLSLRVNSTHISTHRCLTIAQAMSGRISDAQISAKQLLVLDPGLSASNYLARIPGTQFGLGKTFAEALRIAGVPA
jgi:adenylate cyclase